MNKYNINVHMPSLHEIYTLFSLFGLGSYHIKIVAVCQFRSKLNNAIFHFYKWHVINRCCRVMSTCLRLKILFSKLF